MTRPRVFAERCATCVFRPGNPMRLAPGRLADLVRENLARGTALICHTTTYGQRPDIGETICSGWWDNYRDRTRTIMVMIALFGPDVFQIVEPSTDGTRAQPTTDRTIPR